MEEESFSGTRVILNVVVAVLAITPLIYMATHYEGLPERIPTHWNLQGNADVWGPKNVFAVFLPCVLAVMVQLVLWLIASDLATAMRHTAGSDSASVYKGESLGANLSLIQGVRVLTACLLFVVAFVLPVMTPQGPSPGWVPFALIGCTLGVVAVSAIGVWRARRLQHKWEAEAPRFAPEFQEGNWRWGGIFYYNPADPSFLVHKRIGIGFTINCAHPRAKIYGLVWGIFALSLVFLFIAAS